jgi:transposase-like protein
MKRIHVFFVLILVIITGVIFTNCQAIIDELANGGGSTPTHCPYCNAESIETTNTQKKDGYTYYDYKCRNCGKSFRIYNYY